MIWEWEYFPFTTFLHALFERLNNLIWPNIAHDNVSKKNMDSIYVNSILTVHSLGVPPITNRRKYLIGLTHFKKGQSKNWQSKSQVVYGQKVERDHLK